MKIIHQVGDYGIVHSARKPREGQGDVNQQHERYKAITAAVRREEMALDTSKRPDDVHTDDEFLAYAKAIGLSKDSALAVLGSISQEKRVALVERGEWQLPTDLYGTLIPDPTDIERYTHKADALRSWGSK